jgi:hypothetical protein
VRDGSGWLGFNAVPILPCIMIFGIGREIQSAASSLLQTLMRDIEHLDGTSVLIAFKLGPVHFVGQPSRKFYRTFSTPDSSRRIMEPFLRSIWPSNAFLHHCRRGTGPFSRQQPLDTSLRLRRDQANFGCAINPALVLDSHPIDEHRIAIAMPPLSAQRQLWCSEGYPRGFRCSIFITTGRHGPKENG